MKTSITLFLILPLFYTAVFGQRGEIVFTRMTKENGLASSSINSILKDHQGYYWISSSNGLQRFDGKRMVNFQHDPDDPSSLPDNLVMQLTEDNKNRLWMNCHFNPYIFDPFHKTFKKIPVDYPGKEQFNIASFFQDSKGFFWMTMSDLDMFILDTVANVFKPYTSVWPKCPGRIMNITDDPRTGYYWMATDKGIMIYDPKKKEYYNNNYNPPGLRCFRDTVFTQSMGAVYKDLNNVLFFQCWSQSGGWAHYRYDINKDELKKLNFGDQLWGYLTDFAGNTWCYGYGFGHYDYKNDTLIRILPKKNSLYGIDYNEIFAMTQDAENNIWVITNLGLYSFNLQRQYFTTTNEVWSYRYKKSMDGNINGFVETNDGHIISLGWGADGLYFFDSAFNQLQPLYGFNPLNYKDPNFQLTWCGLQDSKGLIWIGCQHGRILQMDPVTNKTVAIMPPEFEDRTIRSITEDKNGNIWFGTQNNIIVKWIRGSNTFKQVVPLSKEKYSLGWVLSLLPGYNNDMWAGTIAGGLLHIDINKDEVLEQFVQDKNRTNSLSASKINGLVAINADTLAIANDNGIDIFDWKLKTFIHLNERNGLPAEGIIAITKDDRNNLWFSTVDGISKIHWPDRIVHNYGFADGITEKDFQLTGVHQLRDKRILFGNTPGFVRFDPDNITNDTYIPSDVVITGFRIFDQGLSVDSLFEKRNTISLHHSENYITIQFASLNNIMSNRPDYYYMLEGIDKDWIKATDNLEATYTYLPGGSYTFKVRCISRDGVAGKNITSFIIDVKPPFWKTWWFVTLLLSVVFGISYYIFLLRLRRRNERELIRNRIARDLHDDMGSTLSTINILSSMAKSKLHTDEVKASEYINKIGDNSQRMMEAMDDIVWAIKPDNDSMQRIVARMREFATNVLEAKDIELDFHVAEGINDVKLNMEQRRDFFLIFKEAVNNVAKYSKCNKATIQIGQLQKRLVLTVKDDGIGFDVANADDGNGLGNMQKRADALKGRLQLQSRPGDGTTVTLNIPVG